MALETLLTYRAIRRFAAVHLQQQTLLEVAQVEDTQMVGCQSEVHRATQDLWTQITRWEANTDPYASTAAGVWEEIAQPESSTGSLVVGSDGGTSDQSCATTLTN